MKNDAQNQEAGKPVLLQAINLTLYTIEKRGWLYRTLVFAVSVVAMVSTLCAAMLRRWLALAEIILWVPLVGSFLALDSRRIG